MFHAFLIKYGEIGIKGKNRYLFEDALVKQIRHALKKVEGEFNVRKEQGRIFVESEGLFDFEEVVEALQRVFGIVGICPVLKVNDEGFDQLSQEVIDYMARVYPDGEHTFKVNARRARKNYPKNSMELNADLGERILEAFPNMSVDVHHPEITLNVEIREKIYIYSKIIPGPGGMPVGTNGKAMLLLSGGIDSPVAGYMMAKRGLILSAVHFYSYPYTSERARDKVVDLTRLLSRYAGPIRLHLVPFTDIQMTIYEQCPSKETTVIMRRLMMKIAQRIAEKEGARALITGEALGQVASQTLESLCVTNDAVTMPVFRPLIGFDKDDIMDLSRKIGTYETSILPYEDCCTVFVPKHPVTKPVLEDLRASEAKVDFSEMIEHAISDSELMIIK